MPYGNPTDVTFRRLTLDDLPLLHRWLCDPDVQRWWHDDDLSYEAIAAEYTPRIEGNEPEEQWFAVVDGREVAWFQTYALASDQAYTDACASVGVDRAGGGFDYLIGDPADRGRGLGPTLIAAFVRDVVFGLHPDWPVACAGPEPENVRSWRALERAGLRFVGEIDTEEGPEHLMAVER